MNRLHDHLYHGIENMVHMEKEYIEIRVLLILVLLLGRNDKDFKSCCFKSLLGFSSILTIFFEASYERISDEIWKAATDWTMVNNLTFCVNATSSRARIYTLLIFTSFALNTVGANNTFWSTSRWTSNIGYNARTNCVTIRWFTFTVRATR